VNQGTLGGGGILGLQIDSHINWKNDTEETIPKLSGTSNVMRLTVHIFNKNTLKSIYYAYFHSITEHGKIVWCNSFYQQWEGFHFTKENYQNYGPCTTNNFCRSLFKQLEILPVPIQNTH